VSQLVAPSDSLRRECIERIVFDEATIGRRVRELGAAISRDYRGCDLVVVGILYGASIFTADLVRSLTIPTGVDFVSISRYRRSSGFKEVKITQDVACDLADRHVLLVEDIIDTGLTLNYLVKIFGVRKPGSISICTLLDRPALRLAQIPVKYVGFEVDEKFLIGYGLDYKDRFRDLPYIASMKI
jgi:hypoxanthine phosphoribosyltransferase